MPEQILIVEDEPSLQETLAYSLTRQGYAVHTVGDGPAAVDGGGPGSDCRGDAEAAWALSQLRSFTRATERLDTVNTRKTA